MVSRPQALLLDFGGVLVEPEGERTGRDGFVHRLHELVDGTVAPELIAADLTAGNRAYARWRDAMARPYAPTEITHEQFWADFVCADWPAPARAAVVARATELAYAWTAWGPTARLRDGVVDVLDAARTAGIALAVVSNTLCGAAFRDFLDRAGVGDRFAAQCYSDEAGVRKPNPALVLAATDALGVAPADAWFVGDTPLRDVLAGRRAGIGRAILVRSLRRVDESDPRAQPDVVVNDMVDVHHLLLLALRGL
jgi:phosphoglycolate phosphatase-like HAD superfamily hydrolase